LKSSLKSVTGAMTVFAAVALAACGGGGGGDEGVTSSTMTNSVKMKSTTMKAGQSVEVAALARMRGTVPNEMSWKIANVSFLNPGDQLPFVSDETCADATYAPPFVAGATGEGACTAVLTLPAKLKSGTYRITNTAKAADGTTVSDSVTFAVQALPETGFRLLESSGILIGSVNQPITLNIPFTVNPGSKVENVKYSWTAGEKNASTVAIAGRRNSSATFIPPVAGQYRFDLAVEATINGMLETATASVVAAVEPPNFTDQIDAGVPQIVAPGSMVSLGGAILNRDNNLDYKATWTQVDGADGGPARVELFNTNSMISSFKAPDTEGTYRFDFKVIKRTTFGREITTTARTAVYVQKGVGAVFAANAGDAQVVDLNKAVTLRGTIGTNQGTGVSYRYSWAQVGTSPAVVSISNAKSDVASFVPTVAGTYTFELTVVAQTPDGALTTVTSQTQIIAGSTSAGTSNYALAADAGIAKIGTANSVVTLTGTKSVQGSESGVTYTYAWSQIGNNPAPVTISNPGSLTASFIPSTSGTYDFRLTISARLADGTTTVTSSDTQVLVGVMGSAFSVSAGDAQVGTVNSAVIMAGTVTQQGDMSGTTFSYSWSQVGATPAAASVSNANALTASFVPSVAGTYTFELQVTATKDGVSTVRTAQTQVLVN
jgi:hypothetical protein